jgi:hypothetical protein
MGAMEHGRMKESVSFDRVLAYLEEHGWELMRIKKPFWVFVKKGQSPLLVIVKDKRVPSHEVERIKRTVEEARREEDS